MQASLFSSRRISQFLLCIFLITAVLFMPSWVCAQAYFGTVSGELTDASGAVCTSCTTTFNPLSSTVCRMVVHYNGRFRPHRRRRSPFLKETAPFSR